MQQLVIENAGFSLPPGEFWEQNPQVQNAAFSHADALPKKSQSATFFGENFAPEKRPLKRRAVSREIRYVSETGATYEQFIYDDGSFSEKLLSVENPTAVYVKKYGGNLYKAILYAGFSDFDCYVNVNSSDLTEGERWALSRKGWRGASREKPEGERWRNNLIRARTQIEEYGLCNPWRYFVTFTIDGEKLSRSDLEAFRKKFNQMIRDLRRNRGLEFDFLFVPELHPVALKAGRAEWHMHGLMNIPEFCLEVFENRKIYGRDGNKLPPLYIRKLLCSNVPVYHWKQYDNAFGHNTIEPVWNQQAAVRYLLKYVSKGFSETVQKLEKGEHLYYVSRGLSKAEKMPPECLPDIRKAAKKIWQRSGKDCVVQWIELN